MEETKEPPIPAAPEMGDAVDVAHEYPSELQVGELDRALDVLMLSEDESQSDWEEDVIQFLTKMMAANESNDLDPPKRQNVQEKVAGD